MPAERSSYAKRSGSWRHQDGTWHGLLFLAMAFSREVEGEMDRALAIVPLSARGFAALYETAIGPEPKSGGDAAAASQVPGLRMQGLRRWLAASRAALLRENT